MFDSGFCSTRRLEFAGPTERAAVRLRGTEEPTCAGGFERQKDHKCGAEAVVGIERRRKRDCKASCAFGMARSAAALSPTGLPTASREGGYSARERKSCAASVRRTPPARSQPKTLRPPKECDSRRSSAITSSTGGPAARLSTRRASSSSRLIAASLSSCPSFAFFNRRLHDLDRLVIDLERHRERMPVLAAMGEREARRIGETTGRAVHHFGHHRERSHRAGADAGNEKQFGEVGRPPIGRRREARVKAGAEHIARAHVVMRGHDEMGQRELDGDRARRFRGLASIAASSRVRRSGPSECRSSSWARRETSARRSVRLTISP